MRRLDDGGMTGARSVDGLSMCDCTGTVSDHVKSCVGTVSDLIFFGRYLCVGQATGLYRNTQRVKSAGLRHAHGACRRGVGARVRLREGKPRGELQLVGASKTPIMALRGV